MCVCVCAHAAQKTETNKEFKCEMIKKINRRERDKAAEALLPS